MKLIDVTNSYSELVNKQLESTDTNFIRVFTLGKTTVIYTEAPTHNEIVLQNKIRKVKKNEVDEVLTRLIKDETARNSLSIIDLDNIVEISIPVPKPSDNG